MPHKIRSLILLFVLYSITLTGCQNNEGSPATSVPDTGTTVVSPVSEMSQEVEFGTLQSLISSPENPPTLTPEPPPEIRIPDPMNSEQQGEASQAEFISESCSPLKTVPLEELSAIISSPYKPPLQVKEERHHGVDFSYYRRGDQISIEGQEIQSIFSGRVAASITESFPYGNFVIIETEVQSLPLEFLAEMEIPLDRSLYILYAHMADEPLVKHGEEILECTLLGAVGKSGNAGIPHLHLETRIGPPGVIFEAMAYYSTQTSEIERLNYERWRTGGEFVHFDPMLLFKFLSID